MSDLFNIRKQLTFYGAYHHNNINVLIHIICVPILLWSGQAMISAYIPTPSFFPSIHKTLSDYLAFDLNWTAVITAVYSLYYFILDPVAAALYMPQLILSMLTAMSAARHGTHFVNQVSLVHVGTWIAQFYGHGVHEKRAPALLDNLVGALVLAPFFVHLEVLFKLGYRHDFQKELNNDISKEIASFRKAEGDLKRAKTQ